MSNIPDTDFTLGDDVIGMGSGTATGAVLSGVVFVPNPEGFNSLCRVNGPVGRWLKDRAEAVQHLAKNFAPYDTGNLSDSIDIAYDKTPDGISADIYSDVFYAGYQEIGTSRNPPHPFLRPALMAVMQDIDDRGLLGGWVDEADVSFDYASPNGNADESQTWSMGEEWNG